MLKLPALVQIRLRGTAISQAGAIVLKFRKLTGKEKTGIWLQQMTMPTAAKKTRANLFRRSCDMSGFFSYLSDFFP